MLQSRSTVERNDQLYNLYPYTRLWNWLVIDATLHEHEVLNNLFTQQTMCQGMFDMLVKQTQLNDMIAGQHVQTHNTTVKLSFNLFENATHT